MTRNFYTFLQASNDPIEVCLIDESGMGSSLLLSGFGLAKIWLELITGETLPLLDANVAQTTNYSNLISGFGFAKGDRLFALVLYGEISFQFTLMPITKTIRLRLQTPTQLAFFPTLLNSLETINILSIPAKASLSEFPLLTSDFLIEQGLLFERSPFLALGNKEVINDTLTFALLPKMEVRDVNQIASLFTFVIVPVVALATVETINDSLKILPVKELVIGLGAKALETINFRSVVRVSLNNNLTAADQLGFKLL